MYVVATDGQFQLFSTIEFLFFSNKRFEWCSFHICFFSQSPKLASIKINSWINKSSWFECRLLFVIHRHRWLLNCFSWLIQSNLEWKWKQKWTVWKQNSKSSNITHKQKHAKNSIKLRSAHFIKALAIRWVNLLLTSKIGDDFLY